MTTETRREKCPEKCLIGGHWVDADDNATFDSINPADGSVAAILPDCKSPDVDKAVAAAKRALPAWRDRDGADRGKTLLAIGRLMINHADDIALRDTADMGKPLHDARGDAVSAARFFEFYGGLADKIFGTVNSVPRNFFNYTLREPVGVVAAVTPWNFPIWQAAIKVASALACGCTVVLKPAEQSPSSALFLGRLCQEAGLPDGVLNVITGDGPNAGAPLAAHPDVDHVSFTGSSAVGREVAMAAASHYAGATCELGGKTPNIIFADCPWPAAVSQAVHTICRNTGQICVAGSRLVIHKSIKDRFLDELTARAATLTVGDPMNPDMRMGPIVSEEQFQRVAHYIEVGKTEGAALLLGGGRPDDPALHPKGLFFGPTVFDNVANDMTIAQEEIFGPVLSVLTFEDDEEALRIANDTRYGLAAWIWTNDLRRAHWLAGKLDAGIVQINQAGGVFPAAPYSGFKNSGIGAECGLEGALNSYTRLKNVSIRLDAEPLDWVPPN